MNRVWAVLLLTVVPVLARADTGIAPRTLSADIPTTGVATLELKVGVGEVHITASADDKVHAKVTLKQKEQEFLWFFHWMSSGTSKEIATATLEQKQQGDALKLSLDYPGQKNDDDGNVKQEWEIQLPARLALDAVMNVGELTVAGVAGGVDAKLNVGELSIDVPRGALRGKVNVGEIRAKSGSAQHGDIRLSSNIGEALLSIAGQSSGVHDHGGLGNSVSVDGKGPDAMELSINIGEVSLHIDPKPDAKDGGK
jgi:hypothetical protein